MRPRSPFLTIQEAAEYCRFDDCADPVRAFRKWANRYGVPLARRGSRLFVEQVHLDSAMNRQHDGSAREAWSAAK